MRVLLKAVMRTIQTILAVFHSTVEWKRPRVLVLLLLLVALLLALPDCYELRMVQIATLEPMPCQRHVGRLTLLLPPRC